MTVRELKAHLDNYNPEAQVTILVPDEHLPFYVMYGIKNVKQTRQNASMELGDEPWMVDVVEIYV